MFYAIMYFLKFTRILGFIGILAKLHFQHCKSTLALFISLGSVIFCQSLKCSSLMKTAKVPLKHYKSSFIMKAKYPPEYNEVQ